jgi:LmbE family N-acetylglucosaminyl deacetylase
MQVSFSDERVLAVVAHPDDAELLCAGLLARAKADEAAIGICVLCQGDKGQPASPIENLALVRQKEMHEAAGLLGAELFCMDCGDGELVDSPDERRKLLEVFRRFSPTLVLAHWAGDYHSDHRAASQLAEAVSWYCCSAGHKSKSPPMDAPPTLWWMDTVNMLGFEPHFYFDVSAYVDLKQRMLKCHASQLLRAEDGDFSPLTDVMMRQCQARGAQSGVQAAEAFRVHLAWKRVQAW